MKLYDFYEPMHKAPEPVKDSASGVLQFSDSIKQWTYHPTITSYPCDTPLEKHMSDVKHCEKVYTYMQRRVCKNDICAPTNGTKKYKTGRCDSYNRSRPLLDKAVVLQRKGQETAAW